MGSRNGNRTYCDDDAGYSFGSSIDNHDFADYNTVTGNTFTGNLSTWQIKNDGKNNSINLETQIKNETTNNYIITYYDKKIICKNISDQATIKILNSIGNVILYTHPIENIVYLPSISKGIYFVLLSDSDKMHVRKILVE
ncbi:MAG: T9SS type A sorting domain-containing protein [Paludibacter sp.]|nr:T9SS type A sorting domain-containing protein [Paludibacter sp.]